MSRHALLAFIILTSASTGWARDESDVVIKMSECQAKRKFSLYLEVGIFVKSSKDLVRKGSVEVAGETFSIYLPQEDGDYSVAPRPDRKTEMVKYTSTYLAVDQNHDGEIDSNESYLAELPLRVGDSMFDVVAIASDGSSITLRPSNGPLRGGVIGRQAPDFEFTTTDGKKLGRDSFEGRALLIDCWAPS